MANLQPHREQELVAQFEESMRPYSRAISSSERERRRGIVAELLTFNTRAEVAALLGVSPQRISQIVDGVRTS